MNVTINKSLDTILVLNSGSSTIKFTVFSVGNLKKKFFGIVDKMRISPYIKIKDSDGKIVLHKEISLQSDILDTYKESISIIIDFIISKSYKLVAIGHRIVHGGIRYKNHTILNDKIISELHDLSVLAPLHQEYNLIGYHVIDKIFGKNVLQVGCFDTAFHTTSNIFYKRFAIPKELYERENIMRYGFHGLSYEYVVSRFDSLLGNISDGKIIVAHLGNGTSMCAVSNKKSVSCTLGFTALDGLPMGTRCGHIDPGVLLYLMKEKHMEYEELSDLLYKKCGLFGLSDISSDMRDLESSDSDDAKFAIDLFAYRISAYVGMLSFEMQGLDGIVFTGGIGENSDILREKVCKRLEWCGTNIDYIKNKEIRNDSKISTENSKIGIFVINTNEELVIASNVHDLYSGEKNLTR